MPLRQIGLTALLVLPLQVAVQAQAPAGNQPQPAARPVAVDKLPVDVARISRQLQRTVVREERDGLNLRYMIDVFAPAPRINLFPEAALDKNFFTGPAPYGAPTHGEILSLITPREHGGGRIGNGIGPNVDLGWLFRQFINSADRTK